MFKIDAILWLSPAPSYDFAKSYNTSGEGDGGGEAEPAIYLHCIRSAFALESYKSLRHALVSPSYFDFSFSFAMYIHVTQYYRSAVGSARM